MAGKINDREKYGGIFENPPHYPGHEFTSGRPLKFFSEVNKFSTEILVFCYLLNLKKLFAVTSIIQK